MKLLMSLILVTVYSLASLNNLAIELTRIKKADLVISKIYKIHSYIEKNMLKLPQNIDSIDENTLINNFNLSSKLFNGYQKKITFTISNNFIVYSDVFPKIVTPFVEKYLVKSPKIREGSILKKNENDFSIKVPISSKVFSFVSTYNSTKDFVSISLTAPTDTSKPWYKPDGKGGFHVYKYKINSWVDTATVKNTKKRSYIVVEDLDSLNTFKAKKGEKAYVKDNDEALLYVYNGSSWINANSKGKEGLEIETKMCDASHVGNIRYNEEKRCSQFCKKEDSTYQWQCFNAMIEAPIITSIDYSETLQLPTPVFKQSYDQEENKYKSFTNTSISDGYDFTQVFGTSLSMNVWLRMEDIVNRYARVLEFSDKTGSYSTDSTSISFTNTNESNKYQIRAWINEIGENGGRKTSISYDDMEQYFKDNKFHLITFNYDNNYAKLYIDGQEVVSKTITNPVSQIHTPETLNIGGYEGRSNYSFDVDIDNVQVFTQALTPEQVSYMYFRGREENLTRMDVKGITKADSNVTIYLDGKAMGDTISDENGEFTYKLVRENVKKPGNYKIEAILRRENSNSSKSTVANIVVGDNVSQAIHFDGTNYMSLENSNLFDIPNSFSISADIYIDSFDSWNFIFGKSNYWSNSDYGIHIKNGKVEFYTDSFRDSDYYQMKLNKWYNITTTYNFLESSRKLYIDSILVSSKDIGHIALNSNAFNFTIGADNEGQYKFKGKIDNLHIYNKELNISEIVKIFSTKKPVINNNLIASYDFEGSTQNEAIQNKNGNDFNGILSDTVKLSSYLSYENNDTINVSEASSNFINLRNGYDIVTYNSSSEDVSIDTTDIANGKIILTKDTKKDTLLGVEEIRFSNQTIYNTPNDNMRFNFLNDKLTLTPTDAPTQGVVTLYKEDEALTTNENYASIDINEVLTNEVFKLSYNISTLQSKKLDITNNIIQGDNTTNSYMNQANISEVIALKDGIDTVTYSGSVDEYTILNVAPKIYKVMDPNGIVDILKDVEKVQFSDQLKILGVEKISCNNECVELIMMMK